MKLFKKICLSGKQMKVFFRLAHTQRKKKQHNASLKCLITKSLGNLQKVICKSFFDHFRGELNFQLHCRHEKPRSESKKKKKSSVLLPPGLEPGTFRLLLEHWLWDWRATDCATEATDGRKRSFELLVRTQERWQASVCVSFACKLVAWKV